jgi:hypothetical protein
VNALQSKNENIHQFIIEEEYARLRVQQECNETFCRSTEQQEITSQDVSSATLEELFKEETALLEEKNQCMRAKQDLEQKTRDQIEAVRTRIYQLKAEIREIKKECQTLATVLQISPI